MRLTINAFQSTFSLEDGCCEHLPVYNFYLLISKEAGVALDVIGRWLLE
jgi:hypothetical protein